MNIDLKEYYNEKIQNWQRLEESNNMKDVMLDLETFGTGYNAVVVQIGACYFNRQSGSIGESFFINVNAVNSMELGFEVDAETIYWWLDQSKEAQQQILNGERKKVTEALSELNSFLKKAECIWSHATFDFSILMNHFQRCRIKPTFHYRSARDLRTLVDLAKTVKRIDYSRVGIHHNALDDCLYQVKYTVDCLNRLKGLSNNE